MPRSLLPALAFGFGFFFLLLWFYVSNVYQTRFFDYGGIVVGYQIARILYIPYLFWLEYAVGVYALKLANIRFDGLKHAIAAWITGTSLWHIVLLGIGLAGLYRYPVMLLLTGGVMVASLPYMAQQLSKLKFPALQDKAEKILLLFIVLSSFAFLLFKGAYPSGGHDFYNHYFPYFNAVIRDGNVGPNEVWYHYFYSKGLGLYFLSMLLLDPLAIHLVGTTFILAAALMVFDLLRQPNRSLLLPLFGVLLYITCYIYTPGRGIFAFTGGWGDLEKIHELTAVLLLALVWLTVQAIRGERVILLFCLLAACCTILLVQVGLFAGLFFALMLVYALIRKQHTLAVSMFAGGCATALSLAVIFAINYLNTGIILDQWVLYIWPLIDWQKVVAWGATLELYVLKAGYSYFNSVSHLPIMVVISFLFESYRLYLWWPLLLIGMGATFVAWKHKRQSANPNIVPIAVLLGGGLLIALFGGGLGQPTSYFRFATFAYAPVLILALGLWRDMPECIMRGIILSILVLGAIFAVNSDDIRLKHWQAQSHAVASFNSGNYSLFDATNDLRGRVKGLSSPIPLQGTYPAFAEIYKTLPYKTRIWNLNNYAYCMLPACKVEQQSSMIISPRWYDIATGNIATGKKIMQEEKLDYIFFSRYMTQDQLADAKDFLTMFYQGLWPNHIRDVYGIAWTNGDDYLLTWKEQAAKPLDEEFMNLWHIYYNDSVVIRERQFSPLRIAPAIKKSLALKHPPELEQ